ncbi:hypothetical protein SCHPADRAFT_943413 [Schizopora paradoxa]|uniref:F-box domain-containing protein n=1 Tax=Schizopora paradoxa TaxID=27342 RepID=A0A0H2RY27_9AGAM|nr:hypothetical protein SCHPADRAFT_943413 [Schizopora paradoxa]
MPEPEADHITLRLITIMDNPNGALATVASLNSLPTEILLSIVDLYLESLVEDSADYDSRQRQLTKLCRVCPNLRFAIEGCSKYWTTISSALRKESLMRAYLTRSVGQDLTIVVLDKHGEGACDALMRVAAEASHRWSSFSLILSKGGPLVDDDEMSFERRQLHLSNRLLPGLDHSLLYLELPRLRDLRVHFGTSPSAFTPDFFTTWECPGLQRMDLMNIAPKKMPTSLTSFSMSFCNGRDTVSMPLLQRFLEASTSIEELSFTFQGEISRRIPMANQVVLANVRSLRLKVEESSMDAIRSVLSAFALPGLESLAIAASFSPGRSRVHLGPMTEVNHWKSTILGLHPSFYNVTSLSLTLIGLGRQREGILSPLSSRFTQLRHFTLETNLVIMIVGAEGDAPEWPAWPPLETIRFVECETVDALWLRDFSTFLGRRGHWEGLGALRIEKCDKLKRGEALLVIPEGDKLEWAETRSTPKETFMVEPVPRSIPLNHLSGVEELNEADFAWTMADDIDIYVDELEEV